MFCYSILYYLVYCAVDWCILCDVFFFKQKTAYEMRISDWSSDVCSSDLAFQRIGKRPVLFGQIAVEMRGAEDILRSRFAACGRMLDIGQDRKSVVSGKRVSVSVDLGGRRILKKKNLCITVELH